MCEKISFEKLLALAENGNLQAQCDLGKKYAEGEIVEQDYHKALYWFNVASENGNAMAKACLGVMYDLGWGVKVDNKKAIEYYQLASYENDPTGMYNLGLCYLEGNGIIKENKRRAMNYMTEAAEAGYINAMKFLANEYFESEEFEKSFYWSEQAAMAGDVEYQVYVAQCYDEGNSIVKQNKDKAFEIFLLAAEQGNEVALEKVADHYAEKLYDVKMVRD